MNTNDDAQSVLSVITQVVNKKISSRYCKRAYELCKNVKHVSFFSELNDIEQFRRTCSSPLMAREIFQI